VSDSQATLRAYGRLTALTPAEAEVYRYVEEGDSRPTDVAEWTDRDPSTVRTLLYRARGKLDERPEAPT